MKRSHGDGGIDERGDGVFRLRYRISGRRYTKTFRGTLTEAKRELRSLIRSGDLGLHVDPTRLTVGELIDQWIESGAPGRKKKRVGQRTLERYAELLKIHIKPTLGDRPLQKLQATEIDRLYAKLDALVDHNGKRKIAPMTLHHVHVTFNSCLATAERKGLLIANPMRRVEQVPSPGESDHGIALDQAELATLVAGFRTSSLFPMVALDAATGLRRNEILALRWGDHDPVQRTLRIERALEVTKTFGTRYKLPKTARGLRAIALDETTNALLMKEKERYQRIRAGVPEGVQVDLTLVRLPDDALMFPAIPSAGQTFLLSTPRNPDNFTKEFGRKASLLGFPDLRFHDLRGTHATLLLDRGIPVHIVAERIGDDPAVLLRNYAKRKRQNTADNSVAAAITALTAGFLKL